MLLTVPAASRGLERSGPSPTSSRERPLTWEETQAVLTRGSVACVHHVLADGAVRTIRARYAREGSALFIPAWTSAESWYSAGSPTLECDVSEVDWRSCWRYVRLRGQVTPLQPTGAARERDGWRQGVALLRRVVTGLAATDELAVANFGIVRMDVERWDGVVVPWGEVAESSAPVVTNP